MGDEHDEATVGRYCDLLRQARLAEKQHYVGRALRLFRLATRVAVEEYGQNSLEVGCVVSDLAVFYDRLGYKEQADEAYERLSDILRVRVKANPGELI